jgi:hypothetical protein
MTRSSDGFINGRRRPFAVYCRQSGEPTEKLLLNKKYVPMNRTTDSNIGGPVLVCRAQKDIEKLVENNIY